MSFSDRALLALVSMKNEIPGKLFLLNHSQNWKRIVYLAVVGMLIFNPFYACICLFIALAVWALNCGYMERTKARLQAEMQESIVKK